MTASSDSGLPPLVEPRPELLDSVVEALRTRGTVMLESDGRSEQWCAACVAVNGALELRVGEPQRSWRRRRTQAREAWLRERGFAHVIDAWALPVPSTTNASECAAILTSALVEALAPT